MWSYNAFIKNFPLPCQLMKNQSLQWVWPVHCLQVFQLSSGVNCHPTLQSDPYQPHTIPPIGGPTLSQRPKIQSRHHLAPKESFDPPKLKCETLEISDIGGSFERKLLMRYSYFRPLWKQGIYTLQLLLGALWKQGTLHITVAVGSPFESAVRLRTH